MSIGRLFVLMAATLVAAGCGGSATVGPCEGDDAPESCGAACADDADCDLGLYCGPDGTCTADCTAGGGQCPEGETCDERGRCVAGQVDAGEDCPRVDVRLDPEIPTVVLLIDQSGSMTDNFGGTSRWEAVKTALVDPTDGLVARMQDRVKFDAVLYTSNGGNAGGTCPILQDAPGEAQLGNYQPIADLLNENSPAGDTPTAESIDAVAGGFPLPDPEDPGPRVLLLATDGDPDNCQDPNAHDDSSKTMSEEAVERAWDDGIRTIPLSVGTEVSLVHLERLADIGVGAQPGSGEGTAYVATDPEELVDAFDDIILGVRSCLLTVDGTLDPDRADEGNVYLNGTELEYGVDWDVVDENTIELLGDACDELLETDSVTLEADFPCGAVVL